MNNGYDTTGAAERRYDITTYLNRAMMGFLEGSRDGLADLVVDELKRRFEMIVPREAVRIVIDTLHDPERSHCWSIHVDHAGQHYESVIVNLQYDTGYEP